MIDAVSSDASPAAAGDEQETQQTLVAIDQGRVIEYLKNTAIPEAEKAIAPRWKVIALEVAFCVVFGLGMATFIAAQMVNLPGWMIVAASVGWLVLTIGLGVASSTQKEKRREAEFELKVRQDLLNELELSDDGKEKTSKNFKDYLRGIEVAESKSYNGDFYNKIFIAYKLERRAQDWEQERERNNKILNGYIAKAKSQAQALFAVDSNPVNEG